MPQYFQVQSVHLYCGISKCTNYTQGQRKRTQLKTGSRKMTLKSGITKSGISSYNTLNTNTSVCEGLIINFFKI